MITMSGQAGCVYDGEALIGHVSCVYGVFRAWRLCGGVREVATGFADTAAAREWIRAAL